MRYLTRRQIVRLAAGGAVLSALAACGSGQLPAPTSVRAPSPPDTPAQPDRPVVPASPTAASRPLVKPKNQPGFYVRYIKPFESINTEHWTLPVTGLVSSPLYLSLSNVLALPRTSQVSRIKCVECWSAVAHWEGFHLDALLELVVPRPIAEWIHIRCADGYYESMRLDALRQDRVLFVHSMNDQLLPEVHGAPLRLMVPSRYGYKSAKAITSLEFAAKELEGYWSTVSSYSTHGMIRPGTDHPLDLGGSRRIRGGGEIIYPDGPESQPVP
jgi:sulfoxide reductase catalytic subunit YedY